MTFLVPVRAPDGQEFKVERLDICVWNLANLFNRQQLIVDVGLTFKSQDDSLTRLGLVLPFAVREPSEWQDISIPFKQRWGAPPLPGPIPGEKVGCVRLGEEDIPLRAHQLRLDENNVHRGGLIRRHRGRWTLAVLELHYAVPKGETAHLRARFHVYGPSGMVIWKRSGLAINGLTLDLQPTRPSRVEGELLASLLKETCRTPAESSVTYVLRASLTVGSAHPTPRPRSLVHGTWSQYLGRVTDLRDQGSLISYSVESSATLGDPAGLFLNATRELGLWAMGNILRVAVTLALMLTILVSTGQIARGSPPGGIHFSPMRIGAGVTATVGVGVLLFALRKAGALRKAIRNAFRSIARMERWFFSFLLRYYGD